MNFLEIRDKIDCIDDQIFQLFIQRMECAKKIAQIKKLNNIPVFNPEREQQILNRLTSKTNDHKKSVKELFENLIRLSKTYQEECNNES